MDRTHSEPLVHIDSFRKDFGATTVIRDLSFDIHQGETFGFLGSNGSGKTTTIRALLGIYIPPLGPSTSVGDRSPPKTVIASATCPKNADCTRKSPSST